MDFSFPDWDEEKIIDLLTREEKKACEKHLGIL